MREQITRSQPTADTLAVHTPNHLESFDPRIMSIERIFPGSKERNIDAWERTVAMISVMHAGIEAARADHVAEKTIEKRLQMITLSLNYAVSAFFYDDSFVNDDAMSQRIPDQLISVATKKNPSAFHAAQWLSNWMLTYSGEPNSIHTNLAERIREERDAKRIYRAIVNCLPEPIPYKRSSVEYWNRNITPNENILGIDGYSRDGVTYLRKIVSDFRALRKMKFHTLGGIGKQQIVSSDSWMFSSTGKIEMLFGESMEQLRARGLQWNGSININSVEDTGNHFVNPINRVIGSAVYALQLRDPFMVNFIALGQYPEIGSFRMPRTTFQNYHESIEA